MNRLKENARFKSPVYVIGIFPEHEGWIQKVDGTSYSAYNGIFFRSGELMLDAKSEPLKKRTKEEAVAFCEIMCLPYFAWDREKRERSGTAITLDRDFIDFIEETNPDCIENVKEDI